MKSRINQGRLRRRVGLFFACFLAFVLAAPMQSVQAQAFSKRFKKGDALRLTIWQPWQVGDSKNQTLDINGNYMIDSRGYVFFPLVGDVNVLSHSARTLAEELNEKFSAYVQDPIVIVEPLIRVALLGAFRRPGTYLISPGASLWELVDLAGGPSDNSNLEKMFLERGGKVVKKNLLGGFERAYTLSELGIRTGDQLLVPERTRFRMRDAFDILRFILSLFNLFFLIDRL